MTGIPIPPAVAGFAAKEAVKSTWKIAKVAVPLLILLAIGIYIAVLKGDVRHLTKERNALSSWQSTTVAAVRSEVPVERRKSVTPETAGDEIHWLGRELRTVSVALADQSAAVRTAQAKAEAADKGVSAALEAAKERETGRAAIRQGLNAPGRSTGLTAAEWGKL